MKRIVLREAFPRVLALVTNKHGKVCEFGIWDSGKWCWEVTFRRNPFGWERQQWESFNETIGELSLVISLQDKMIWKHEKNGNYSAKYFYKSVTFSIDSSNIVWKLVWSRLASFKAKVFC